MVRTSVLQPYSPLTAVLVRLQARMGHLQGILPVYEILRPCDHYDHQPG